MSERTLPEVAERLRGVAERHPALSLLLVHGSRARGDATAASDWDFAFLAAPGLDVLALAADLARQVGTERVDVADLARASALLRYRAARDGVVVHESAPGEFARFWMEAVRFWCDAAPILEREYGSILERLDS